MSSVRKTKNRRENLQESLDRLVEDVGQIPIGDNDQFPLGWRQAAKGRTVWRIVEEVITQSLEVKHDRYGLNEVKTPESEVGVFDFSTVLPGEDEEIYINIKTSVVGGRRNKDDISKARKLRDFFEVNPSRDLFISTFKIDFTDDMAVDIVESIVMPVKWIPDIYVNPSSNANLQSSWYKDLPEAEKRDGSEFLNALKDEIEVANRKREKK